MKDDIIRMAREAGCIPVRHPEYDNDVQVFATPDELERFAALVAAAEREACAGLCDSEATIEGIAQRCAAAIRARGQDPMPLFDDWNKDWTK
jgi:hypothetical protein